MRVTIDTNTKTITIHGSFTYSDFERLNRSLKATEWADYKFSSEPEYTYTPPIIYREYEPPTPPWFITCTNSE